jgi:hypothetical protein
MRSHYFLFLRILAIRVAFEANSMDRRQARKPVLGGRRSCSARGDFALLQYDQSNNSGSAQHSWRGVRRLRGMRDLSRTDRARFPNSNPRATADKKGHCE